MKDIETFRARALAERAAAEHATLTNRKDMHLQAAKIWEAMAAKAERTETLARETLALKAGRSPPRRELEPIISDEVRKLITEIHPAAICDICAAEKLPLLTLPSVRYQASELAIAAGFNRRRARCNVCNKGRMITYKV
jgi:hypothetical protein